MSPLETINEIAIELGVDPSFIEKDWYAVKVIEVIAGLSSDSSITPIFCGGTSLSKAYGLLKRFSEDLDFRGQYTTGGLRNKAAHRAFRNEVLGAVATVDSIEFSEADMVVGGNYFKIPLKYPRQFHTPSALRPELKLEFSFTQPQRESEVRPISSFIAEFSGANPEARIMCLSSIETAADKLSALIWRVLKRDRKAENDDPSLIRHLHDLSPLLNIIEDDKEVFVDTARVSFDGDMRTGARRVEKNLSEAAKDTLNVLRRDDEYKREYERFVAGMSYADAEEIVLFELALDHLEAIIGLFD